MIIALHKMRVNLYTCLQDKSPHFEYAEHQFVAIAKHERDDFGSHNSYQWTISGCTVKL